MRLSRVIPRTIPQPLPLLLAIGLACGDSARPTPDVGSNVALPAELSGIPTTGPEAVRRARLIEPNVELDLRDAPYQFHAELERNNGRIDTMAVAATGLDDTTVAQVVDGAVTPRDVGATNVRIDLAPQLRLRGSVVVSERIASDSVWLSRGQVRAWELRPGMYRITVDAKAAPGEPQPLELAADLLCAPDARAPRETISCRVRQNTRMLLRHTGAGSAAGPSLAVVTIVRVRS
ncbi:MAG: hypothetical protein C0503_01145 [Gemmatimonas sp.]|nr:hypothetical protein [Gemmatimonas sp.]